MEAYSIDLRKRVVAAHEDGGWTLQELADLFHVSLAWVKNLLRRWREKGTLAPLPGGRGFPPKLDAAQIQALTAFLRTHPDATQEEMRNHLSVKVSQPTLSRALAKHQLTFKKNRRGPANKTVPTWRPIASGIKPRS